MFREFKDLVVTNRSYRGYDASYQVSREELLSLVDLARLSASSANRQPLKYRLVTEPGEVSAVQAATKWAKALPQMKLPHPGKCPTSFIIICVDHNIAPNSAPFMRDIGAAAQNILLGAVELGLGGCMIGSYDPEKIMNALDLDSKLEPALVVAVGKPDEKVIITEVGPDGNTSYYRDENDTHYVPKRSLEEIVI